MSIMIDYTLPQYYGMFILSSFYQTPNSLTVNVTSIDPNIAVMWIKYSILVINRALLTTMGQFYTNTY